MVQASRAAVCAIERYAAAGRADERASWGFAAESEARRWNGLSGDWMRDDDRRRIGMGAEVALPWGRCLSETTFSRARSGLLLDDELLVRPAGGGEEAESAGGSTDDAAGEGSGAHCWLRTSWRWRTT